VETGGRRLAYGHADLPLSAEGLRQRDAMLRFCQGAIPPADGVLSSDLRRCLDIAEPLAAALGLPLRASPALREQSMGDWEGQSWEALTAADVVGVRAWWSDYAHARPPGGERLLDLAHRVGAFWEAEHEALRGRRWIVVTHIGVIRASLCGWLGYPLSEALRFTPAPSTHTWVQRAEAGAVVQLLGERTAAVDLGAASLAARSPAIAPRGARPRIGLSGSAGTGKSTLGRALAEKLDLPYIPEGMRSRIEGGLSLHSLDHDGLRALVLELWAEQVAAEEAALAAAGGFVSDRSPIDYAAFWLHYHFTGDEAGTAAFFAAVRERVSRYDRVVALPWGTLPLVSDGVRATNPFLQRHYQATVEGLLLREVEAARLALLPPLQSLDARVGWVLDHLAAAGTRG
jgi:broad specificity phosphatase PhoE/nicotinamide riboside kinase